MDAQQFLAEFGHIANAPGGVGRLRELILLLAIQGRLVPQNELEETVDAFLSRADIQVRSSTRRRTSTGYIATNLQSQLPMGWQRIALNQLAHPQAGFAFKANLFNQNGKGLPIIRVRDVGANAPMTFYSGDYREEFLVERGDWLIAMDGDFRVAVWEADNALLNQRVTRLQFFTEEVEKKYVCIALQFELRKLQGVKNYTTVDHLSGTQIAETIIALPPPREQSRIVAKVDELMALCDTLEALQQARRKLQNNLRLSTLQAVASATSPRELQTTWARLADNFGGLFHASEDVADLRQVILDLAFTGNISEQSESVTSNLVESLHLRKMQLSAEKRIKRETPVIDFPGIAEMLGNIPDQWAWVRLNDIASVVRGGSPRPAGDPKFYGGSIPFLKVADVTAAKGMFVERFTSTITEAGLNKTREISTRTVLLTNSGATLGVPAICEFRTTFNDGVAAFIELNDAVFDEYLYLFLKSKTKWLQDIASRGQGQPNLNTEIIRSMWFPLAPISEQHRIVTRISELMRFCDVLEANLKHVSVVGRRLAVAAVSSLTGIAIEQEEEPVKAPQTELVAPLRLGAAPDIKDRAPLATILARHNGEMSAKDLWQRFGGEIDAFYAQLKTEVAHGWILEPAPAEMREKPADAVSL